MSTKTNPIESIQTDIEDLYFMSRSLGDDFEAKKFSIVLKDLKDLKKTSLKLLEEIETFIDENDEDE